jgi:hypothetical protein
MKRPIVPILFLLLLISPACKTATVQHPGSIDKLDSTTYDVLVASQVILDNTKIAINQGKLPASAKQISNAAGFAYNELRDLWLQYRSNPDASTATKVKAAVTNLDGFVAKLRGLGVKP